MDALSSADCYELLRSEQVGHLAVVSEGLPYVTPVSYVVSDTEIAMRVGKGRRVNAIAKNPEACFEVSRYDDVSGSWRSVIVEGTVEIVDDVARSEAIVAGLLKKYAAVVSMISGRSMPMFSDVIIALKIRSVSGRSSGSFFSVRTRPGRL